jgi:hypothetical protein
MSLQVFSDDKYLEIAVVGPGETERANTTARGYQITYGHDSAA